MSTKALKILWWAFALFCLTFSTLAFLRTRGMTPAADAFGILDRDPPAVPALALPVELLAFGIFLWLTHVWCREVGGSTWASRIPIGHFDKADIDPIHHGGKMFQSAAIGAFLAAPFLLLLLMCVQYLIASIHFSVKRGPTENLDLNWWSHFATPTIYAAPKGGKDSSSSGQKTAFNTIQY